MEGVGSFLCEQRRGAEEELLARPQLQMEVGHSALLTVNQCKSFTLWSMASIADTPGISRSKHENGAFTDDLPIKIH